MATQNVCDNDITVVSINPINITSVDDITLSGGNLIDIAGTNGTTIQDDTSIAISSSGTIISTSAGATDIVSNAAGVAAIGIGANNADPSTTIQVGCASGTGDEAVLVYAEGGGITLQAATNVNVTPTNNATIQSGGSIFLTSAGDTIINATGSFNSTSTSTTNIISNDSVIAAMSIGANGVGTGTTMQIGVPNGTSDEAVLIYAEAGGINLQAATNINIDSTANTTISAAGVITLSTTSDGIPSIQIVSNGGPDEIVNIGSVQGTSYRSVQIYSDSGGITIEADGPPGLSLNSGYNIGLNAETGFISINYTLESEGVRVYNSTALQTASILVGTGSPQGVLTPANPGSLYIDVAGGGVANLYTNSDGTNTGWYSIVGTQDPGGSGVAWQVNSSAAAGPFTLVPNNGYFAADSTATVQYNLPVTAAVGDTYTVFSTVLAGLGNQAWAINQNAGQNIIATGFTTTTGVGHGLVAGSTTIGTGTTLVCLVANTTWVVVNQQGNNWALM